MSGCLYIGGYTRCHWVFLAKRWAGDCRGEGAARKGEFATARSIKPALTLTILSLTQAAVGKTGLEGEVAPGFCCDDG
jgi:hypothetical protein